MNIKVVFERNDISKEYILPLNQSDVVGIRRELKIPNEERVRWGDFSDENIFPNTQITYKIDTISEYNVLSNRIAHMICAFYCKYSFIEVNMLAYVMQCYYYNDAADALEIYMDYTPPEDILELMNQIISMENIYEYYYAPQYDCDCIEEGYAKTEYGNRFPEEYWNYVDFTAIGDEDGQECIWFGEYGWIYDYQIANIDISDYSFEYICEDFEWGITPPTINAA